LTKISIFEALSLKAERLDTVFARYRRSIPVFVEPIELGKLFFYLKLKPLLEAELNFIPSSSPTSSGKKNPMFCFN